MRRLIGLTISCLITSQALSSDYFCPVSSKTDGRKEYSATELAEGQYSVRMSERDGEIIIFRCSYSPSRKVVDCDDYQADHVEVDQHTGIRKYYYFRGQFDVQVFPNGGFIENNGRGSIATGTCRITSK